MGDGPWECYPMSQRNFMWLTKKSPVVKLPCYRRAIAEYSYEKTSHARSHLPHAVVLKIDRIITTKANVRQILNCSTQPEWLPFTPWELSPDRFFHPSIPASQYSPHSSLLPPHTSSRSHPASPKPHYQTWKRCPAETNSTTPSSCHQISTQEAHPHPRMAARFSTASWSLPNAQSRESLHSAPPPKRESPSLRRARGSCRLQPQCHWLLSPSRRGWWWEVDIDPGAWAGTRWRRVVWDALWLAPEISYHTEIQLEKLWRGSSGPTHSRSCQPSRLRGGWRSYVGQHKWAQFQPVFD